MTNKKEINKEPMMLSSCTLGIAVVSMRSQKRLKKRLNV